MKGKTIRIFLADGAASGVLTAEIINWTGKVMVSPRAQLADLVQRDESKRTGVYCLVGPDPETPMKDRIYIGEGDSVRTRLTYHDRDESKDFWTRVLVVTSKDENLTKSHVRYLESRLLQLANEAGRGTLANGTAPDCPLLPEPDIADMEYFLEQIQLVLPVLGFSFLQPKPDHSATTARRHASTVFEITAAGTKARAIEASGEIVVLKGSTARKEGTASWTSFRSLRDQLVTDGNLIPTEDPAFLVFAEDVAFSSPSAAASVVIARNTNGRVTWKTSAGKTYADWHEEKIAATGVSTVSDD